MSNILIQGLALSGLYALVAVGFTMIFSVGRVLNLAYGVYIMLGGYTYYTVVQVLGMPKLGGFALALLSGVAFGVLAYTILVRRLEHSPIAVETATLILAVVMQALIILVYEPAHLRRDLRDVGRLRNSWSLYGNSSVKSDKAVLRRPCVRPAKDWSPDCGDVLVFVVIELGTQRDVRWTSQLPGLRAR